MKGFFITGTDTDCGKTFAACALITALKAEGLKVAPFKPIAAGGTQSDACLKNDDVIKLLAAAHLDLPYEQVNPYCFEPPIAPHIAASIEDVSIDVDVIVQNAMQLSQQADLLVVEGAGGWLVPLNEEITLADLATELALPVILVVGLKLGCLNHALLTEAAIKSAGLPLIGWIGSTINPEMSVLEENINFLNAKMAVPCLGILPCIDSTTAAADALNVNLLKGFY